MTATAPSLLQEPAAPTGIAKALQVTTGVFCTHLYLLAMSGASMALPHMQGAFSAGPDQIAWVVTAFIVTVAMTNACAGWLTDHLGRRRLLLICVVGFTLSSVLVGLTESLEAAVLARVLQGMFCAPLAPLGQAIAVDAWPRDRQAMATSVWSMGALWGSFIAPLAGGYLAENLGWQWVFYMPVPIGILTFITGWLSVHERAERGHSYLDWLGFFTLVLSIGSLMYGLSRGERLDWFASGEIIAAACIALLASYVFVARMMMARRPFIPMSLFKDRNYTIALLFIFIYGNYNYLPIFVLPIILTSVMGLTLPVVGALIAVRSLGSFASMLIVAPLSDRVNMRVWLIAGFLTLMAPFWMMARWGIDPSWSAIIIAMFLHGFGSSMPYIGISAAAFATLPVELRSQGMSLLHLTNNMGVAIGTTAIFALLAREMQTSYSALVQFVSPYNEAMHAGTARNMLHLDNVHGLASMGAEVSRQATMVAFNSTLQIAAYLGLIILPLLFFARVRH
ncbi:MAG: DHA2 family efflux MFS transporter permease subunit [Alphaproteobacteria bacterium]